MKRSSSLVGATALALAGCAHPGAGGAGATTIIQNSPTAASTPATPSVTPINDGKALCVEARSSARELTNSANALWKLMHKDGWNWDDQGIIAAADKVLKVEKDVVPRLERMVGPNAPSDIADAVHGYVDAAKNVAQAVGTNASNDELKPLGPKFGDADDVLRSVCRL